jgi:two-component system, NtrC family, response regulator AtoC
MTTRPRLLIVEDEADAANSLQLLLEPRGYQVRTAATAAEARRCYDDWHPGLVLLDLMLPDASGLDLLAEMKSANSEVQVIMVTGYGSIPTVVQAMNAGAMGFIEKPIEMTLLLAQLDKAREKFQLSAENKRLKEELRSGSTFGNMIARSESMRQVLALVRKVAPSDASVLVHGENGTGKELVASAIHQLSRRASGPFIKINCAAIPSDLIESELFGHRRGAFTGAVAERAGLLELADGGSVLFDEIGEMQPALQAKLLRVLQEHEFRPVGGSRVVKADFRLICSTNIDLDAALADRRLREDLYFRINTVTMRIPPLRERPEDIPLLTEHFIEKYSTQHGRPVEQCSPEAMRLLQRYRWPGNVRELEHAIERAVIVSTSTAIIPADLPQAVHDTQAPTPATNFSIPPHHTLEEIERLAIIQTLERTRGNKRAAASILGVYRPTLYSKLRKYKIVGYPERAADAVRTPRRSRN